MWLGGGAHWESERSHRAIPVVLVEARIEVIEVIVIVVARLGYAWRPAFADKNVMLGFALRWCKGLMPSVRDRCTITRAPPGRMPLPPDMGRAQRRINKKTSESMCGSYRLMALPDRPSMGVPRSQSLNRRANNPSATPASACMQLVAIVVLVVITRNLVRNS